MRLIIKCLILVLSLSQAVWAADYAKRYPTDTPMQVYTPASPPPANVGVGTTGYVAYWNSSSTIGANQALQFNAGNVVIGSYNVSTPTPKKLVFGEYPTTGPGTPQLLLNSQSNWFGLGVHNPVYADGSEFRQGPLSDPPSNSWGPLGTLESNFTMDSNVGIGTFATRSNSLAISGNLNTNSSSGNLGNLNTVTLPSPGISTPLPSFFLNPLNLTTAYTHATIYVNGEAWGGSEQGGIDYCTGLDTNTPACHNVFNNGSYSFYQVTLVGGSGASGGIDGTGNGNEGNYTAPNGYLIFQDANGAWVKVTLATHTATVMTLASHTIFSNGSLDTDGTNIYSCSGTNPPQIVKWSVSGTTGSIVSSATWSAAVDCHMLRYDPNTNFIYATSANSTHRLAKINPNSLAITDYTSFGTFNFTDDSCIQNGHLYLGDEAGPITDITLSSMTGVTITDSQASYGMYCDGTNLYNGSPNGVLDIYLNGSVHPYSFSTNGQPNEIWITNAKNIYYTSWTLTSVQKGAFNTTQLSIGPQGATGTNALTVNGSATFAGDLYTNPLAYGGMNTPSVVYMDKTGHIQVASDVFTYDPGTANVNLARGAFTTQGINDQGGGGSNGDTKIGDWNSLLNNTYFGVSTLSQTFYFLNGHSLFGTQTDVGNGDQLQITATDGADFLSLIDGNGTVSHTYDNGGGNIINYTPGTYTQLSDQNIGQGISCNNTDCSVHIVTNNYGGPDYIELGIGGSGNGNGFISTNGISTGIIEIGDGHGTLGNFAANNANFSGGVEIPSTDIGNDYINMGNGFAGIYPTGSYLGFSGYGFAFVGSNNLVASFQSSQNNAAFQIANSTYQAYGGVKSNGDFFFGPYIHSNYFLTENGDATPEYLRTAGIVIGASYYGSHPTAPTSGISVQGNVGMGTWNPTGQLEVEGNVSIGTHFSNAEFTVMGGNVGIGTWIPSNLFEVGTRVIDVQSGGNVGIGSITPGQKLDVQGTVRALSSGTCTTLYRCVGGVDDGVIQTSACVLCPAGSCVATNLCG